MHGYPVSLQKSAKSYIRASINTRKQKKQQWHQGSDVHNFGKKFKNYIQLPNVSAIIANNDP